VMSSDMRIKIPRNPQYFYPDASVVCGQPEFDPQAGERTTLLNPKVVTEVLSPSTESYDRGKKLAQYIKIPSLEEYVLVSQDEPRLDTFFRRDDGSWTFSVSAGSDATVALRSMGMDVPLAEIYAGIEFPPQKEPPSF
jgi:Uma2 family endonuclease